MESIPFALDLLVLYLAWPILMAYALYRVVLVFGRWPDPELREDAIIAGIGAAITWWGRVVYGLDLPGEWSLALTVLGVALMVLPKLINMTERADARGP